MMTRQIVLRPQTSSNRRQPLLYDQTTQAGSNRFGEVVGSTAAECAAVCCCCPCALMDFVILAVYKLPVGLCRKALNKKRSRRLKNAKGLFPQPRLCTCGCDGAEYHLHPMSVEMLQVQKAAQVDDPQVIQLEKEMWDKFYGTGFWRSPSQREETNRNNHHG